MYQQAQQHILLKHFFSNVFQWHLVARAMQVVTFFYIVNFGTVFEKCSHCVMLTLAMGLKALEDNDEASLRVLYRPMDNRMENDRPNTCGYQGASPVLHLPVCAFCLPRAGSVSGNCHFFGNIVNAASMLGVFFLHKLCFRILV